MTTPKRLVLFVEGEGDRKAAPLLVKKMLSELNASGHVILDDNVPMKVGEIGGLVKDNGKNWKRFLGAARKQTKNLGAVLLLLDGDVKKVQGESFCAVTFAHRLAALSKDAGAESVFSVAVVFACQEFESWIIGCVEKIAGQDLPDGRPGIKTGTTPPQHDLEKHPRDAKGWLAANMEFGYSPDKDQALFTRLITDHLAWLRGKKLKSFQRLEHAMREIIEGLGNNKHFVSPSPK